jgi:triacylglycerol esterase/lipase EstA (alpha/beta hydrolase family)
VSGFSDTMGVVGRGLGRAGVWLGRAGVWVGQKAADGYRMVDPDVMRHVAQTPLLACTLLVPRRAPIEAGEPDGHPPLVFVHGLGGNRGNFLAMAWYLRLHGRKRSYSVQLSSDGDIPDSARDLAAFVEAVREATRATTVDIVAHSLGGLVARIAVTDHGLADHVRTLVTLGTPHAGTHPARFANTSRTRDLRPDSALIQRVNAKPWPDGVHAVTFWSRNDLIILPAESAAAPGTETIDVSPFTHYSYLIDPRSWIAVAKVLAD